jgi:tetratricopeptide (TPR) repeat protein
LYATQLVGDWVERGVLEPGTSGFVLAGAEVPDIPDDVHALWLRRLDRMLDESLATLPRTARTDAERMQRQVLLELAAALGGRVDMVEWIAVCSRIGIADPTPVLEPLVATRLAQLGDDGWAFSHGMLRDSLERIARERRRWASHNRLCADMLEQRRPVPHWGDSERIGRHRFAAAQYDAATRPLLRGARERVRLDEYAAALALLALYDRALDELGRSPHDPQRLEGWLLRADIHSTRHELEAAEAAAHRVRTLAQGAELERFGGAALLVSARVHEQQGRLRTALEEYRRAQEALRVTGPSPVLAACLTEQAHVLLELGLLDEAWETFHDAQAIHEDTGQMVPWSENQLGLARVAVRQGDVSHAMALCRRVRTFGRREGLSRVEAAACAALAEAQTAAGRLADAIESLDRSIQLFEEIGLDRRAFRSKALRILLLLESGAEGRAASELAQLRTSPIVDAPLRARLLLSGVSLALAVGDPDADFAAHVQRTAGLLADVEPPARDAARALRLALARARERGLPERAARIEALLAATPPS